MVKYKLKQDGTITKDGHTMFKQDIVTDLNRIAFLEENRCLLYVDPEKSCKTLKKHQRKGEDR